MIIAVDFDGTIVEDYYPFIGAEKPHAISVLKKLKEENHKLILWTVREGKALEDAVNFCHSRGLDFYAVNANSPTEQIGDKHYSRKLKASFFIDDRALQDLPSWLEIYKMIQVRVQEKKIQRKKEKEGAKVSKRFWKSLLRI